MEIGKLTLVLLLIFNVLYGFVFGIYICENGFSLQGIPLRNKMVKNLILDNFVECNNLTVEKTAYCLRDYVRGFYNYTERSDIDRIIEDIKERGGDCFDYSLIYEQMAKELGFKAKKCVFYGEDIGHAYVIIWDDKLTGYCKLDQLFVDCLEFR